MASDGRGGGRYRRSSYEDMPYSGNDPAAMRGSRSASRSRSRSPYPDSGDRASNVREYGSRDRAYPIEHDRARVSRGARSEGSSRQRVSLGRDYDLGGDRTPRSSRSRYGAQDDMRTADARRRSPKRGEGYPASRPARARNGRKARGRSNERSMYERMYDDGRSVSAPSISLGRLLFYVVVAIVAIVAIMALFRIGPFAGSDGDGASDTGILGQQDPGNMGNRMLASISTLTTFSDPVEGRLSQAPTHEVTASEIKSLSGQTEPFIFDLAGNGGGSEEGDGQGGSDDNGSSDAQPLNLSETSQALLASATRYYDENGCSVGYMMLDLESGRGVASNLDERIYGASSIKGPFCAYISQDLFPSSEEDIKAKRKTLVEKTILYSDNASYQQLRKEYAGLGFDDWLTSASVRTGLVTDTYYPEYSARESALMWLKIYDYLENSGTTTSEWLSKLFAKTEVSFMRNGIAGTESVGGAFDAKKSSGSSAATSSSASSTADEGDGDDGDEASEEAATATSEVQVASAGSDEETTLIAITESDGTQKIVETSLALPVGSDGNTVVRNKAGWIAGVEDDAICDSGIVTINGRDYLMIIMTSARDNLAAEHACAELANALAQVRNDFA